MISTPHRFPFASVRRPRLLRLLACAGLFGSLTSPFLNAATEPVRPHPSSTSAGDTTAHHTESGPSAAEALTLLAEGNARFVANVPQHRHADAARRAEVAQGQNPLAVILACADSRVPPELLFDQGIGDLFVIRVAGNVVDPHTLGSIEYAVDHLGTKLIVVLGHERCGAVTAARSVLAAGGAAPGNVQSLVADIAPSVLATPGQSVDATAQANVRHSMERLLAGSALIREAAAANTLQLVAAWYDLDTGKVSFTPSAEGASGTRPAPH